MNKVNLLWFFSGSYLGQLHQWISDTVDYHLVPFAETSIACLEHNPMKVAGSSTLMYQVISRYGTKHGAASSVSQCSRSCQISLFHVLIILHLYIYMCVCIRSKINKSYEEK